MKVFITTNLSDRLLVCVCSAAILGIRMSATSDFKKYKKKYYDKFCGYYIVPKDFDIFIYMDTHKLIKPIFIKSYFNLLL